MDTARLSSLLGHLHEITHLQLSLHDTDGREIYSIYSRSAFCDLICGTPEGYRRCVASDACAIRSIAPPIAPFEYRCHAGLIDTVIPVTEHGRVVVIILFGQILDETPLEEQWVVTQRLCAWHPQPGKLKEAFYALPRLSGKQIRACYEIINACVSEIRLKGMIWESTKTDTQRLTAYIDAHYATQLTLGEITCALSMGKSKLYLLASEIEPGLTITRMIARRRVDEAKRLLQNADTPIREIAEKVGMSDYNYFTKVFKRYTGMTPTHYRKAGGEKPTGARP